MRMMMKVTVPVEAGNAAITSGMLPRVVAEALERLKPEAAYFVPDGVRTAIIVFDLKDPSDMPGVAEPFFSAFNAGVSFTPVMNAEDLKKGLGALSK